MLLRTNFPQSRPALLLSIDGLQVWVVRLRNRELRHLWGFSCYGHWVCQPCPFQSNTEDFWPNWYGSLKIPAHSANGEIWVSYVRERVHDTLQVIAAKTLTLNPHLFFPFRVTACHPAKVTLQPIAHCLLWWTTYAKLPYAVNVLRLLLSLYRMRRQALAFQKADLVSQSVTMIHLPGSIMCIYFTLNTFKDMHGKKFLTFVLVTGSNSFINKF